MVLGRPPLCVWTQDRGTNPVESTSQLQHWRHYPINALSNGYFQTKRCGGIDCERCTPQQARPFSNTCTAIVQAAAPDALVHHGTYPPVGRKYHLLRCFREGCDQILTWPPEAVVRVRARILSRGMADCGDVFSKRRSATTKDTRQGKRSNVEPSVDAHGADVSFRL